MINTNLTARVKQMQFPQFLTVLTQFPLFLQNFTDPVSSYLSSVAGITSSLDSVQPSTITESTVTGTPGGMLLQEMLHNQLLYSLPGLPYAYDALEPYISAQIMELHHKKHHQAYINNLNAAKMEHVKALAGNDVKKQLELQQVIKFNGGGHINHSLFWRNLSPANSPDASPAAAPKLIEAIIRTWGSYDKFKDGFSSQLLKLQGSGWGWLSRNCMGTLVIVVTKDQDPVLGGGTPLIGVDMWEHAYYLQYYNDRAAYVKGIWSIINWKTAEERFLDSGMFRLD